MENGVAEFLRVCVVWTGHMLGSINTRTHGPYEQGLSPKYVKSCECLHPPKLLQQA